MSHQKKTGHRLLADRLADGAIRPETLHSFLYRINALLNEHLANHTVNVNWLADQLGIDRKTLYRNVQGLVQQAPVTLIRHYRLQKAADLLRAGHSAGATSRLVGFATPSHFTTVFREFYRQTPTEFIASRKKNAALAPFSSHVPQI